MLLPKNPGWLTNHRSILRGNYNGAEFVDKAFIEEYYSDPNRFFRLQDFNEFGIFYLKEKFGINTKILRASELDLEENLMSTDLLVDVMKKVGGDVYISGQGGKKYLEEWKFAENGLKLEYFEFRPFPYPQRWENFEPYLSALDLLFNVGSKSMEYIHGYSPEKFDLNKSVKLE